MKEPHYKIIPTLTDFQLRHFYAGYHRLSDNECWPWLDGRNGYGYGRYGMNNTYYSAHRIALSIVGRLVDTLDVRHLCNNPICVNPAHLMPGTHEQNMQDMADKLFIAHLPMLAIILNLLDSRSLHDIASLLGTSHVTIMRRLRSIGIVSTHRAGRPTIVTIDNHVANTNYAGCID